MKKLKFIYLIYLFFPLINLLTGLMTRYNIFPLTIGIAIRIALLLFLIFYVLFYSKSKYKKISTIYIVIIAIYSLTFLLTRDNFMSLKLIYIECNYLFKFLYYPIMFFGLINLFDEYKFDKKKWNKIFLTSLIFYTIFIIIPVLTKSSFSSYVREKIGLVGWFYAANEVGAIMLLLYPAVFPLIEKNKKTFCIVSLLALFSIVLISTKVSRYGIGLVIILFLICYLLFKKKNIINKLYIIALLLIYIITISEFGEKIMYKVELYNANNPIIENKKPNTSTEEKPTLPPSIPITQPSDIIFNVKQDNKKFIALLLSGREQKLLQLNSIYKNQNLKNKILGIGFYPEINGNTTVIEMDFMDIFYHYGIFGFLLLLFPYIYMIHIIIKGLKSRKFKLNLPICYTTLIYLLVLCIGALAGHVLGSPAVSSFLVIYAIYLCTYFDEDLLTNEKENQ